MRPGPRIQAAIELLDAARTESAPDDRLIAAYFRQRRYAGSGDRAAVGKLFYAVLRRRAWLEWRLGHIAAGPTADGRALVLAQLADANVPDHEIAALFDGSAHAPAPLILDEQAVVQALRRRPTGTPPPAVLGNYPGWVHGSLERRFATNLAAEMAALNERAPLDLRVNRLKATRAEVLAKLAGEGIEARPTPFSRDGIRIAGRLRLDAHPLYREGRIEVQDEGSQIVAALVGAKPGESVLDLCAGAGGKTLALAAAMAGEGRIVACDVGAERLRDLAPRSRRAGVNIVETHVLPDGPERVLPFEPADRVLVDAPCSGTGTWRRNPGARWRLSQEDVLKYSVLQDDLLRQGAEKTKPGGVLVYAVCSLLPEEGEERIAAFLAGHTEAFEVVDIPSRWPEYLDGAAPGPGPYAILSPRRSGTDGFFIAVLRRRV